MIYSNPSRKDTFGPQGAEPVQYVAEYEKGETVTLEGKSLPADRARDLREGKLARLTIELR